jgi:hypothetical protein
VSESTNGTPVLDLIASMTAASIQASTLDARSLMIARIAALVAVGAPPVSYLTNLGAASDMDIGPDEVRGILTGVMPIVGTARVAAATGNIVRALGFAIEVAALEAEAEEEDGDKDGDG